MPKGVKNIAVKGAYPLADVASSNMVLKHHFNMKHHRFMKMKRRTIEGKRR